jgi:uncharacterized membrane protein
MVTLQSVVMDQPSRRLFPRWPSFAVLLLAAAYLTMRWDAIPARWVIHWGPRGEPNGWATKTLPGVYGLLVLPVALIVINEATAALRRRDAGAGAHLYAAAMDFGRIMTLGVSAVTALLAIILPLGPQLPLPALIAVIVAPLLVAAAAGGVRLAATRRELRERGHGDKIEGYHALYYANANDRRLWVPKLSGLGWTINFSHPLGWPMFLLLLAVPIAAVVLSATGR